MISIIERVIFLQNVDVFSELPSDKLALIAAVAEEITFEAGDAIYKEGDASDAMYLVIDGVVSLHRGQAEVTLARAKEAFGTWALFDDELRVVGATVSATCRVLRVSKDDFVELLADNVEITQAVLKAVVGRLRAVVSRVGPATGH